MQVKRRPNRRKNVIKPISSDRPRPATGREFTSGSQKRPLRLGYRCKYPQRKPAGSEWREQRRASQTRVPFWGNSQSPDVVRPVGVTDMSDLVSSEMRE